MKIKLSILFLFAFFNLSAQEIIGSWKGNLDVQGMKLPLVFHFSEQENKLIGTMDSPMQGAKGIPLDTVVVEGENVKIVVRNLGISYKGIYYNDTIKGIFRQSGMELPLALIRKNDMQVLERPQTPHPPFNYQVEDVEIYNSEQKNLLAGTFCKPINKSDFPIVVMITGSGAQNRNEEIFGHKPFFVLSDYLAKKGIGSLRMDDRGVGGSEKGKANPTSEDFATDIIASVDFLTKKGYTNIGLLGHSEGGMIAPMVAIQNKQVKFLVLLAAPGIPVQELMLLQTNALGKSYRLPPAVLKQNAALNLATYDFIQSYVGSDFNNALEKFIIQLFEQEYGTTLSKKEITSLVAKQQKVVGSEWFRYFIKFNPKDFLQQLKIPVLAINGSLDLQVPPKENLQGIQQALEKSGNKNYAIHEFEGLNHLFQHAKTGLPLEYGQLTETISPEVLEYIADWVIKNRKLDD